MIGDRLKQLRTGAGLDGPAFAAIAGTTKQYVSQLESGTNKAPNALLLMKWAKHFGVRLEWLVTGELPRAAGVAEPRAEYVTQPAAASQSVGPSFDTISSAIRLLGLVADLEGKPSPNITPFELFAAMEIIREEEASPESAEVVDFRARYLARLAEAEKAYGSERRAVEGTGPEAGTGKGRSGRKKAAASAGRAR